MKVFFFDTKKEVILILSIIKENISINELKLEQLFLILTSIV